MTDQELERGMQAAAAALNEANARIAELTAEGAKLREALSECERLARTAHEGFSEDAMRCVSFIEQIAHGALNPDSDTQIFTKPTEAPDEGPRNLESPSGDATARTEGRHATASDGQELGPFDRARLRADDDLAGFTDAFSGPDGQRKQSGAMTNPPAGAFDDAGRRTPTDDRSCSVCGIVKPSAGEIDFEFRCNRKDCPGWQRFAPAADRQEEK